MATASNESIFRAYFHAFDVEIGDKINKKGRQMWNLRTRGKGGTNLMDPSYNNIFEFLFQ